ncbi:phosphate ABC transporter membrane protein 2, PhoT family (TC 3.A.1.7.1) [Roseateles sp. YR242]|uniref:phosphate ABC transporter permease PstA n=1 Tax=Roseateles sp. YR242 TaxID=1855305 RepID=UPI0008B619B1|nr:phosphate ABC transporter permease PstA [Roseateles sp. YR242]SEL90109.1 phosphate ABC transporter membrane protein 2, PhoT family (TC 3.A.1.7.1) [Roseateles sp. YR242]
MSATSAGRMAMYNKRRRINILALSLSMGAMCLGLVWLIWILFETITQGIAGLNWAVFTQMTPPPNADDGGLANAIFGSALMVALATLIGTPIGVLAGVHLSEYGQKTWLGNCVRFINDILLSAPSIVIGLFVYSMIVLRFRGFSGWAGVIALALIVIPVVIRTTENMLNLVPNALREAAYALGTPKWKVIMTVTLKSARAGVITGVLLALARVSGETAPLLLTAFNNRFWSTDLSGPMANLPKVIFDFAMSPYGNWQKLAWAAVFIITIGVLVLNILARVVFKNKH